MKRISLLLVAALLVTALLGGCGNANNTESSADATANPEVTDGLTADGLVGGAAWGDTMEELKPKLGDAAYTESKGDISHIVVTGTTFYGLPVSVDYMFYSFDGVAEQLLAGIAVEPESGSDLTALKADITSVMGEMETKGYQISGDSYELTEANRYWHSAKTIAEAGGDSFKQSLLDEGYGASNNFGLTSEEYTDYMLAHSYPVQIGYEETENGTRLYINGNWAVLLLKAEG